MGPNAAVGAFASMRNIAIYQDNIFLSTTDAKLGTHSCGKVCLYLKRLSDVHVPTLTKLIQASVKHGKRKPVPS